MMQEAASLPATLETAFATLAQGVADRRHGFHCPMLATIGLDGAPSARTLVLRGVDAAARQIRLHTDRRAAKVPELAADPRAALLFYDAGAQLQLRLSGRATLHAEDAIADRGWAESRAMSRFCYAIAPAPGTPVPAPPAMTLDSEAGRPHFCVVIFHLESLESLHLAAAGHRRARFAWDRAGGASATWLVP